MLQAVDERFEKESLVHTRERVFPQVKGLNGGKVFLFPQVNAQTVHKLCHVVHRLSTGRNGSGLGGWDWGGYRCGRPVPGSEETCRRPVAPLPRRSFPEAVPSVDNLWIVGITSARPGSAEPGEARTTFVSGR